MEEHLSGTDIGVIVFAVAYLLGKIADFIMKVQNGKKNPNQVSKDQPVMQDCLIFHQEVRGHFKHRDANVEEAVSIMRKLNDSHHGQSKVDGLYSWQLASSFAPRVLSDLQYIKDSLKIVADFAQATKEVLEKWQPKG